MITESDNLRKWFNQPIVARGGWEPKPRYALHSLKAMCEAVGCDQSNFTKYLKGQYALREPHLSNMVTLCENWGYKPVSNEHRFL